MKNRTKIGLVLLLFGLAIGCKNQKADEATTEEITSNQTAVDSIPSNVSLGKKESNRKFVRTADLKFKVKNVVKSSYTIENLVSKNGGFVTFTDLKSNINEKTETKISQDSTLETTRFTVDNTVTIRIPNTQLDTILKSIAKEVAFLDSRLIKADDVALQLLSNKMAQKRLEFHQKRLEKGIDNKGKKLNHITNAEDKVLAAANESDATVLRNLSLEDHVNYSTVTLYLYQRESVLQEIVANEKNTNAYRPHIGLQIWDSLKTGWFMLETIIAFIVQLWALFLLAFLGIFGFQKFMKK